MCVCVCRQTDRQTDQAFAAHDAVDNSAHTHTHTHTFICVCQRERESVLLYGHSHALFGVGIGVQRFRRRPRWTSHQPSHIQTQTQTRTSSAGPGWPCVCVRTSGSLQHECLQGLLKCLPTGGRLTVLHKPLNLHARPFTHTRDSLSLSLCVCVCVLARCLTDCLYALHCSSSWLMLSCSFW